MFFINRLIPSVCQLLLLLLLLAASRYQSCFKTRPLNRTAKYTHTTLHKVHTTQTLAHEEIQSPKWIFKFWSNNIFTCKAASNNNNSLSPQVWQDGNYCKGHNQQQLTCSDWIAPTMSPPSLLQQQQQQLTLWSTFPQCLDKLHSSLKSRLQTSPFMNKLVLWHDVLVPRVWTLLLN